MNMSNNGKGDRQRPKSVNYKTWSKNWDNIFKSSKKENPNERRNKGSDKRQRP